MRGQNLNKAVPGVLALEINTALCRKVKAIYFFLLNRGGHIAIRSVEEKRGDIINILVLNRMLKLVIFSGLNGTVFYLPVSVTPNKVKQCGCFDL